MKRFFWLSFFTLLFGITTGYSQSYRALRLEGDVLFKDGFYELAVSRYEECHRLKPTNYQVSFNLGVSYLLLNRMGEARETLQTVYDNKKVQLPNVVYYMGFLNHRKLEFRKAAKFYKEFLANNSRGAYAEFVKVKLRNCEQGILLSGQSEIAVVTAFEPPINSTKNDFHPVYSPNDQANRFYFSSNRAGVLGGLRNNQGEEDSKHGHRNPDMFKVNLYPTPEVTSFSGMMNTSLFDEVLGFSFGGQRMYYKKGYTKHSGLVYEDNFLNNSKDRISSKLLEVPFDIKKGDATPFFFLDSVVFFSSRVLEGYGGYDIFASSKTSDGWTKPINLGAGINSAYDEQHPFMTNNKQSLYFSSNKPAGIGDFDIYKSIYSPMLSRWNKAENMGIPINSADDDLYFQMADDGWHFMLSSNRFESMGMHDIFEGQFFEQQNDQVVMTMTLEKEEVVDSMNISTMSVLFQKYPIGAVIPTEKQFEELQKLSELWAQYPEAKLVLNIHMTTSNTKGFKDKLDPLSNVLVSYLNSKVSTPINVTRRLLSPKKTFQPGTYVEAVLQFPSDSDVQPINSKVKRFSFVPRLASGLRYKIEVDGTMPIFDEFLDQNKYDFSFNLWPEEDEQIHILYRAFYTYITAKQWAEQLEGAGLRVKRIIPFLNGTTIEKMDKELLDEFPELRNFILEQ